MSVSLTRLACPSCAAPLSFPVGVAVLRCPYCGTETVLEGRQLPAAEVESRQVAPFSSTAEAFQQALLEWLSEGDYTPDDILEKALVTEFSGLFLPVWKLSGEYHATFTARAGIDREVQKIVEKKRDDGSIDRKVKTETKTDWRPMSGEATGPYTVWTLGSSTLPEGLRDWAEETASACTAWQDLTPELLEGNLVEEFAISAAEARGDRAQAAIRSLAEDRCRERVPGDRVKDLSVDFRTRDNTEERYLHPFWLASFEYGEKRYLVGMSGRNLATAHGERPVDAAREAAVKALNRPWKISLGVTGAGALVGFCAGGAPGIVAALVGGAVTAVLFFRAKSKVRALLDASKAVRKRVLDRMRSGVA